MHTIHTHTRVYVCVTRVHKGFTPLTRVNHYVMCVFISFLYKFSLPPRKTIQFERNIISNNSSPRDLFVYTFVYVYIESFLALRSVLPFTSFNPSSAHTIRYYIMYKRTFTGNQRGITCIIYTKIT